GGKKKSAEAGIPTEELIDLDAEEAQLEQKPGASGRRPRLAPQANPPMLPTTSPFELSDMDLNLDEPPPARSSPKAPPRSTSTSRVEVESASDQEVVAFDRSKAPADLGSGEIPLLSGDEEVSLGDLAGPGAGNSGIGIQDPKDSGISLEDGGSDEIEFELSL